MKKIAKKIGTDTIYCGSNNFAGSIMDYHFLIKYDSQSSVYTLSFSVELDNDITKLNNNIKKEIKDAIVSYNNKNLNIVGSVTDKKYLPEIINPLLEIIGKYLKDNNALEVCRHCKEVKKTFLVDNDSEISFYCNDVGLFMVLVAHEINCAIYIYNLYKADYMIKLIDAYKAIPYYLNTVKEFHKIFNNGLLTGYLLSIIGVFTSYSLQRQNVNTYEIRKIGEK